jgi:hypothetical protein
VNFAALHLSYAAIVSPATYVRGAFHCFSAKTEAPDQSDLHLREADQQILAGFLRSI